MYIYTRACEIKRLYAVRDLYFFSTALIELYDDMESIIRAIAQMGKYEMQIGLFRIYIREKSWLIVETAVIMAFPLTSN